MSLISCDGLITLAGGWEEYHAHTCWDNLEFLASGIPVEGVSQKYPHHVSRFSYPGIGETYLPERKSPRWLLR